MGFRGCGRGPGPGDERFAAAILSGAACAARSFCAADSRGRIDALNKAVLDGTKPSLFGIGLYPIPEAARLAEVAAPRVRGWMRGYAGRKPLIGHTLPDIDGRMAITFRELVEVRFIRHFLSAGVTWGSMRKAAEGASLEMLDEADDRLCFSTDGVTIFAERLAKNGDATARDLVNNQLVMLHVLEQGIRSEFDLEATDVIRAWHPRAETRRVLVDPRRAFGHPIVEPGVPTKALADALRAEGDARQVAAMFGVAEDAVQQAARFELAIAA